MEEKLTQEQVLQMLADRKIAALREELSRLEGADVAELLQELPEEALARVYRILPKETAAEAFAEMSSDTQEQLIRSFTDRELHDVLQEMYVDDTVDMIEEMPASVARRILAQSTPENRRDINELLKYASDSAGGTMTTEYMRLRADMTVEQAFAVIRRDAYDKESVYTCYVTDDNRHLIGVIDVKTLLLSDKDARIADLMEPDVIYVTTSADREEVAHLFEKYNFIAIPVTDAEKRLVGIITFDDAMDVIHEENEEDFAKMAAMAPSDTPYLKTSVFALWKNRIPWLLLLMVTATFTGMIISSFESALAVNLALSAFIPMLMDTGGNSGSQASVTVIRGLSLGEIGWRDVPRVLWKELRVSILCGLTLSVVTFVKLLTLDRWLMGPDVTVAVAFSVALTLLVTVCCAKLIGCSLPILAKKLGFDPAVMASPFITTVVDAVSLLVYFSIAKAILGI